MLKVNMLQNIVDAHNPNIMNEGKFPPLIQHKYCLFI